MSAIGTMSIPLRTVYTTDTMDILRRRYAYKYCRVVYVTGNVHHTSWNFPKCEGLVSHEKHELPSQLNCRYLRINLNSIIPCTVYEIHFTKQLTSKNTVESHSSGTNTNNRHCIYLKIWILWRKSQEIKMALITRHKNAIQNEKSSPAIIRYNNNLSTVVLSSISLEVINSRHVGRTGRWSRLREKQS